MLILIFSNLLVNLSLAGTLPDTKSVKSILQNGVLFTEKMTIHYPENFDRVQYKKIVEKLGYIFQPHSRIDHDKFAGNELIYSAQYTIGDYGLRIIPATLLNKNAKEHLIAAGDSNVFSEGTKDFESFTAHLSRDLINYYVYNFGHRGGGPHNTLSMMENYPFQKMIKEPKGIFLYNFFTGHMFERVIGSKNYIAWDTGMSPYYDLNNKGELQRIGQFNDRTIITPLYKLIAKTAWLNDLLPILPQINEGHTELIAKVILRMKEVYLAKFPQGRFIMVINNSYMFGQSVETKWLMEKLAKNSIEMIVIDYLPQLKEGMIFSDMHLNGSGHKVQSQVISEKLLKILSLH